MFFLFFSYLMAIMWTEARSVLKSYSSCFRSSCCIRTTFLWLEARDHVAFEYICWLFENF